MRVLWKLSWFFRRCWRILSILLTLLGCYVIGFYLLPGDKRHSHSKVAIDKSPVPSSPPPPPLAVIADHWLIINTTNISLCNKIASQFGKWKLLFVTSDPLHVNSSLQCHSLRGVKVEDSMLNKAYLYAISKGADVILIILQIDDLANVQLLSHLPLDKEYLWTLIPFLPNPMQWFNAIEHFGCSPPPVNVLPSYRHCKVSPGIIAPVILQGDNVPEQLQCDETSPLVTMEPDSYVDFDLAKAVFVRSTFWALPLFSRVAVKHRTEWNYVVQWLLFQTGHGLTTYLPRNYRKHVNNLPFPVAVVQLLSQSQCTSTFDKCIILQLHKLSSMRLVSDEFMDEVENWIIELTYAGYVFPIAKRQTDLNCSSIPVTWSPVLASAASKKPLVAVANVKHSAELRNQLCQPHRARKIDRSRFGAVVNLTHPWHQFRSILLVITFNKPHYDVIPYLELLYRSLFPHILYCGPSTLNTAGTPSLFEYRASFITYTEWPVHRTPGSVSYQCAIQVARMNFAVDGFLFTSDDLLLLPVPLARLREDRVWFVPANEIRVGDLETLRECRLGMCDFHPRWDWWETYRSATIETLNRMKQMSRSSLLFYRCLAALREQNGVGRTQIRVNGAYSDIFYLPSRIAHSFADVAEVFADSGVFLEIAVPTVLRCLEPLVNFQALRGKDIQLSIESRSQPWLFFKKSFLFAQSYLHPVKWSPLLNQSEQHVQLLCTKVLPYMHDPFSRLD